MMTLNQCRTIVLFRIRFSNAIFSITGKQAVLVLTCDNPHMAEDVIVEPGLVMIFAHGIE